MPSEQIHGRKEVSKPTQLVPTIITLDKKHDLVSYEYGWFFRDRTTASGNTNKYFSTLRQACKFLSEAGMQSLSAGTTLSLSDAALMLEKVTQDTAELLATAEKALQPTEID